MDDVAQVPGYEVHQALAKALMRTLQDALEPQFARNGVVAKEDFTRAFAVMMEQWPRVTPLFQRACQGCAFSGRDLPPLAPPLDQASGAGDDGDSRRRDYLTRLVLSTIEHQVGAPADSLDDAQFPRVFVPGLQANLNALFYEKEWEAINFDAREIFHQVGADGERDIWARVIERPMLAVLTHALHVRILMRFKQFNHQRQTFIRRMVNLVDQRSAPFSDAHFNTMFEALFGHLRDEVKTEIGRARVDIRYGEETAGNMLRIFDEFDQLRLAQAIPTRTLAGNVRTPKVPRPAPPTRFAR